MSLIGPSIRQILQKKRQLKREHTVLALLALIVAFSVSFGLRLDGEALTHKLRVLDCGYEAPVGEGYAGYCLHTHNDDCYDENGALICPLEEIQLHTHDESCYETKRVLVCPLEESEGHRHTEDCFALKRGELLCRLPESEGHLHGEDCYDEQGKLVCSLEESEGHTHTDDCYAWEKELVCGLEVGEGAHTHGEECWAEERTLACDKPEITEEMLHVHTEDCYDEEERLICGKQELTKHVHGPECFTVIEAPAEETPVFPAQSFEEEIGGITVKVDAPEGAFPEGTEMRLSLVPVEDLLEQIGERVDGEIVTAQAVDICFFGAEGEELEPLLPIRVEMRSDTEPDEGGETAVIHILDDGSTELVEQDKAPEEANAVSFEADAFSVYVYVQTRDITTKVITADGSRYNITVSYEPEAGVPEGATLAVEEIAEDSEEYAAYLANTENALGWEAGTVSYARVFDISILDPDGAKVVIQAPVSVRIELDDKSEGSDLQVVHFADGGEHADVVGAVEVDGSAVSFSADGFSAYAIVAGPDPVAVGWDKLSSIDELTAQPVYIGHTSGYYLMNTVIGDSNRTGIKKTALSPSAPAADAVPYWFEPVDGTTDQFRIYCMSAEQEKQYVFNAGNNSLSFTDEAHATAFTVMVDASRKFKIHNGDWYWNMQGGAKGTRFCSYNNAGDGNNDLYIWYRIGTETAPYDLGPCGLMSWNGGVTGKAIMAASTEEGLLDAKVLTVLTKSDDHMKKLYVTSDAEHVITMWSFEWAGEADLYYIKANTGEYLKITPDGLQLAGTADASCRIQVVPGTGVLAGKICLKSADGSTTLTYNGNTEPDNGSEDALRVFGINGDVGTEWLYLVNPSEIPPDYFMTHSAAKVSVSDTERVHTGSKIIVYTRFWNEDTHKYEFYAIDHDGTLVPCFESGDSIEWVGPQVNTMLWQFTEYDTEYDFENNVNGNGTPNGYFELYNRYTELNLPGGGLSEGGYLAPQITGTQLLSPKPVGVILNGRHDGLYYSPVLTWDDPQYAYAGLMVIRDENDAMKVVPCELPDAMDFYFALMEDLPIDDTLHTVPTVDNEQYGISMKLVDFSGEVKGTNCTTTRIQRDVLNDDTFTKTQQTSGLLSTNLGEDGYPTATRTGTSLAALFNTQGSNAVTAPISANHLFIQSTYNATGYYEYDSQQNYAYLENGDFVVYKELGSYDSAGGKTTLKHGQFFPFNRIQAGTFCSVNKENLYSASTGELLPESDPRKYEQLYLIENPNKYFGMELEASFVQTPSGLDAWGHDIIFEFSGDDDFWLYVDGELVIDLGGIHSAIPGTVNFRTGQVNVNGTETTLRDLFRANYEERGENPDDADALFQKNSDDQYVFKDGTKHDMHIFYMERGAGASNLHMRFNLASVKKGSVQLRKELSGVQSDTTSVEFPYQILYKFEGEDENAPYHYLTNIVAPPAENNYERPENPDPSALPDPGTAKDYVLYSGTTRPVKYARSGFEVDGVAYRDVFFLKPNETADISFPIKVITDENGTDVTLTVADYYIVECGVDPSVYDSVSVNDGEETVTAESAAENRMDYAIGPDTTDNRPTVTYVNHVKDAKSLTLKKELYDAASREKIELYDADGQVIDPNKPELQSTFTFRLFLGTETQSFDDLTAAYMYTYHVKNPAGEYCRWDEAAQSFIPFKHEGHVVTEYSTLAALLAQDVDNSIRNEVCFKTSINGSFAQIPAYYTVEFPDFIAGTKFAIGERDYEVPDGYRFREYVLNNGTPITENYYDPITGITGVKDIMSGEGPEEVIVRNERGFGLRVRKTWSDAEMLQSRDPVYFAVFYKADDEAEPALVDGTLRQLKYADDPQSLYWYFPFLPVSGSNLEQYAVYEVTGDFSLDEEGNLTGFDAASVRYLPDKGYVTLSGTPKGESEEVDRIYQVTYEEPETTGGNVRIFKADNEPTTPTIVIMKQDWSGNGLGGAKFDLNSTDYISGEDGSVCTMYPYLNKDYSLTEETPPIGYCGLPFPLTIRMDQEGMVTVTPEDSPYFVLTQATETSPATLIVKNRPYEFRAIKVDGTDPRQTLSGAEFRLFRKRLDTSGSSTFEPMSFDEDGTPVSLLVTGQDGLIPHLDNTLPAGTYELREIKTASGYLLPIGTDYYIHFTVSSAGEISLVPTNPDGVTLNSSAEDENGPITYTLTIPNEPVPLKLKKTDASGRALPGAKFGLFQHNGYVWTAVPRYSDGIDLTAETEISLASLAPGRYRLDETEAPDGYVILSKSVYFRIAGDRTLTLTDEDGNNVQSVERVSLSGNRKNGYVLTVANVAGVELPQSGGPGTELFRNIGGALGLTALFLLLYRRRKKA